MKRNAKHSQNLETFKTLHGRQKLQYVWDYYKLPLTYSDHYPVFMQIAL